MATIFDNVELQPPKQGPPGYLTLAMLVANCWLEAEKVKEERLARERGAGQAAEEAPTLETIMERAGLKIPGIKDAIAQMMGGGDEVQQAMGLIDRSPDPAKLLQNLVGQVAQQHLAGAGLGTRHAEKSAAQAPPSGPERPAAPVVPLFRPEFTREAREAARAAAARSAARVPTSSTGTPSTPPTAVPPSIVERIERRIDALRQETQKFQTMLETRLASAQAQIAALRDELRRWTRVSTTEAPAAQQQPPPSPSAADASPNAPPIPTTETKDPLPSATEAEVIRSVELVEAFAEELAAQNVESVARVEAVEREIHVLAQALQAARAVQTKATDPPA